MAPPPPPPRNAWGNAWGRVPKQTEAPPLSASAFPDLGAAQQVPSTRRARAAARTFWDPEPNGSSSASHPTRVEELNRRATHWRRTGRVARDIAFQQDRAPTYDEEERARLEDDERGASMASLRVRDKTQGAARGAWASLFQAPADPLRTTAPSAVRRTLPTATTSSEEAHPPCYDVRDLSELATCPTLAVLDACFAQCTRTMHADAREGGADAVQAYAPWFRELETVLASPAMLYRMHAPALDSAEEAGLAVHLRRAAAQLPDGARRALDGHVGSCLDTLAAQLRAADAADDGLLPQFVTTDGTVAPAACAVLAVEVCAAADVERIARLASAVALRAWAQPGVYVARYATGRLGRLATCLSSALSARLGRYHGVRLPAPPTSTDVGLQHLVALLRHVWAANVARTAEAQCAVQCFYAMATELGFGLEEYQGWVHAPASERGVHWLCDVPCVLSMGAKVQIFAWEARQALRQASTYAWLHPPTTHARAHLAQGLRTAAGLGAPTPEEDAAQHGVVALHVRRTHLVEDSYPLLALDAHALLRPLKVTFDGELGQDVGGVQKEYLLLLCEALCAPASQLFCDIHEAPMHGVLWFAPTLPREASERFDHPALQRLELLGLTLGLALVHQVTLPLRLARRVYAHLLHAAGARREAPCADLAGLREVRPALSAGLTQLLEHDLHTVEALHLTWTVPHGTQVHPLGPHDPPLAVTGANRDAYVARVCTWLLHDAVRVPLAALTRGFVRVAAPPTPVARTPLALLLPEELEMILRGRDEPVLDVDALQASTTHVGFPVAPSRYAEHVHQNLAHFWSVWRALGAREQHALLGFVTGSPRVPALGPASVGLRIQHVDDTHAIGGTERVPWSSTCTSTLFLPVYASRAVLEQKVRVALQHSTGFGLG